MNFGTRNLTFTDPNLGSTQVSVKQQINVLKMGINYRFGNTLPQQYPWFPNLPQYPNTQLKIPTARDATSAMVASEIADSAIISSFARTVSGNVSAGENAVAFVNAKKR